MNKGRRRRRRRRRRRGRKDEKMIRNRKENSEKMKEWSQIRRGR